VLSFEGVVLQNFFIQSLFIQALEEAVQEGLAELFHVFVLFLHDVDENLHEQLLVLQLDELLELLQGVKILHPNVLAFGEQELPQQDLGDAFPPAFLLEQRVHPLYLYPQLAVLLDLLFSHQL
jgi:hypothetical protein